MAKLAWLGDEHPALAAKQRSLNGLQRYFDAVSATGMDRDEKLRCITEAFAEDAELIKPDGRRIKGISGVAAFYGSPDSPVMEIPNFKPRPRADTMSISSDGRTIAVEIRLPLANGGESSVGDFFRSMMMARLCA
eukprot:TRINITY_DN19637_c0_g1_i1.p1 TRINITY_DN19637_c0_g1~~TRINITY_DN19637_c0_g1_i1.p1  ORF type:complete len:135 (-),score=17.77 TRINITY_DN19637_c0_g1_i1:252-656(-)